MFPVMNAIPAHAATPSTPATMYPAFLFIHSWFSGYSAGNYGFFDEKRKGADLRCVTKGKTKK
jgi:hypothetical protein